jgi:hypothetical protein
VDLTILAPARRCQNLPAVGRQPDAD